MYVQRKSTLFDEVQNGLGHYRNLSNNLNHPIIQTPPLFQEKCLIFVFQAFEHRRLKLLFQYPNTYIATSRGARTGVAERLPAFDSLCGARARVTKRLLDYYCHCGARTGVAKREPALIQRSLRSSNRRCQTCTSLRRFLQS